MANRKPMYEQVAEKLIDALEKGTSPFQKAWENDGRLADFPYNPVTNRSYSGMNPFWLMLQQEEDPRWMTFKQAQSMGWQVARGEKGTMITVFSKSYEKVVLDENKKPVLDAEGNRKKKTVERDRPLLLTAHVFNARQVIGIPPFEIKEAHQWDANREIDKMVRNSGVNLSHGGNSAFYNPVTDRVQMPHKEQFPTPQGYYSTLMHEMGHWTGHETRLDRPMVAHFGSEDYAREELRAEIASLMLEGRFGLPHNFGNHAAYVQSWIRILKDEPLEIMRASADAQKITDYVLQFRHKRAEKQDAKVAESLKMNDRIDYNGRSYVVKGLLPNRRLQLIDASSGRIFALDPDDRLYGSLAKAKTGAFPIGEDRNNGMGRNGESDLDNAIKLKR